MKIETAIEILTYRSNPRYKYYDDKELPAIKLGIEALKREQLLRREIPYDRNGLLPGETKEE